MTRARARAEMYLSALPHRLSAIAAGAQEGDAVSRRLAAEALAAASDRLGHTEVAFVAPPSRGTPVAGWSRTDGW